MLFFYRLEGFSVIFFTKIQESRPVQLAKYTVFDEESESAVRIDEFLHPEDKIKKNQN